MKTRTVKPCGYLLVSGDVFILLSPEPVAKDSWQDNGTYRFACVPSVPLGVDEDEDGGEVEFYDYARHIVTNNFTIEYRPDMKPINIKFLEIEENYE